MSRCTTREPVRHYYHACMDCPERTARKEKQCKMGYDVFYFRKSKDNHCSKCLDEIKEWWVCKKRLQKKGIIPSGGGWRKI